MFDHADPPALAKFPHAHPAPDESVIVIAVFVILPLLLHGDVTVALAHVFPPAHQAHQAPDDAFDQLFCIVHHEKENVPNTNTLNHAVLKVAPAAIVRLL